MTGESVEPVDAFDAPYGRRIDLQSVVHESGLRLLRVRIREGRRFTVIDVDSETASRWAAAMREWAGAAAPETGAAGD